MAGVKPLILAGAVLLSLAAGWTDFGAGGFRIGSASRGLWLGWSRTQCSEVGED